MMFQLRIHLPSAEGPDPRLPRVAKAQVVTTSRRRVRTGCPQEAKEEEGEEAMALAAGVAVRLPQPIPRPQLLRLLVDSRRVGLHLLVRKRTPTRRHRRTGPALPPSRRPRVLSPKAIATLSFHAQSRSLNQP